MGAAPPRPHVVGAVEAQAVHAEILQPHHRRVAQKVAHLATVVVGPGRAPGREGAAVVVEVLASVAPAVRPVEAPEVKVGRAEVVVHHVQNHRDAPLVGGADEPGERVRAAVTGFDGEQVGRVVAPTARPGEPEGRHHFDRVDAEPPQVIEPADRRVEGARTVVRCGEGAHMQLVEHQVVPARHLERLPAPVDRARVEHHRVAAAVGHLPGERVDAPPVRPTPTQQKLVVRAGVGLLDEDRPGAGPCVVGGHRHPALGVPPGEVAGHVRRAGVRRPDPKRHPAVVGHGAHAGVR